MPVIVFVACVCFPGGLLHAMQTHIPLSPFLQLWVKEEKKKYRKKERESFEVNLREKDLHPVLFSFVFLLPFLIPFLSLVNVWISRWQEWAYFLSCLRTSLLWRESETVVGVKKKPSSCFQRKSPLIRCRLKRMNFVSREEDKRVENEGFSRWMKEEKDLFRVMCRCQWRLSCERVL